jgi:hypothetical protein
MIFHRRERELKRGFAERESLRVEKNVRCSIFNVQFSMFNVQVGEQKDPALFKQEKYFKQIMFHRRER